VCCIPHDRTVRHSLCFTYSAQILWSSTVRYPLCVCSEDKRLVTQRDERLLLPSNKGLFIFVVPSSSLAGWTAASVV
jgi:hypothetical protein